MAGINQPEDIETASKAEMMAAENPEENSGFLIAAIGASAGGIEAFGELMHALPANTGMAFVLVQHLDPKHHSILGELIGKKTKMPVLQVTEGMRIEPNHVYVIPPNATMSASGSVLHLQPRDESGGLHMTIDHFMRSLAEQQGNRAIGSGVGWDAGNGGNSGARRVDICAGRGHREV